MPGPGHARSAELDLPRLRDGACWRQVRALPGSSPRRYRADRGVAAAAHGRAAHARRLADPGGAGACRRRCGAAREHLPAGARILIEPGRSMVARSAVTVYRVTTVKPGAITFVGVDGGMGDNLEAALVGQRFEATIADRVGGGEPVTVVGRHCESGDVLSENVPLRDPKVGDLLVIPGTGAYCFTMPTNYNGARRIPVVFADRGDARLVVRRERWAELLSRDV